MLYKKNTSRQRSPKKLKKIRLCDTAKKHDGKQNNETKIKFMNDKGKVELSRLKYDLNELFDDTPIFEAPLIEYADMSHQKSWKGVAGIILSPFGKLNKYITHINSIKTKERNIQSPKKKSKNSSGFVRRISISKRRCHGSNLNISIAAQARSKSNIVLTRKGTAVPEAKHLALLNPLKAIKEKKKSNLIELKQTFGEKERFRGRSKNIFELGNDIDSLTDTLSVTNLSRSDNKVLSIQKKSNSKFILKSPEKENNSDEESPQVRLRIDNGFEEKPFNLSIKQTKVCNRLSRSVLEQRVDLINPKQASYVGKIAIRYPKRCNQNGVSQTIKKRIMNTRGAGSVISIRKQSNKDLYVDLSAKHKQFMDLSNSIFSTANTPIISMARLCSPSSKIADRRKMLQKELMNIQSQIRKNLKINTLAQSKYREWEEKAISPRKTFEKRDEIKRAIFKNSIDTMRKMYHSKIHDLKHRVKPANIS
ncbi:unnamed protein product [Moneuplotes crassus]|uniref:Uncharacterized protein n=1 Tax=Euplotes crassus TaxID=5936 RepID=A0AAD1Y963_EUPCR|nr:unnamed protein product [Moneuplotes crassus]